MKIVKIENLDDIKNYGKISIAHGFFDGVHVGHQELINASCLYASQHNILSGVITFDQKKLPNNSNLDSFIESLMLSTFERKCEIFNSLGVDIVFVLSFSFFSQMSATEYIDQVVCKLGTVNFVIGSDNKFGKNGQGTSRNIDEIVNDRFDICIIHLFKDGDTKIGSSKIKYMLKDTRIDYVNKLLGYYYKLGGYVIGGEKLGRTLGFPTANIQIHDPIVVPMIGVYATFCLVNGVMYKSMTNIGYNPSVKNYRNSLNVETYIFNFDREIYGEKIYLYFIEKIRNEKNFDDLNELMKNLNNDLKTVEVVLSNVDKSMLI